MEKEILVEVKNVSKKFCTDLKTSLRYGVQDSLKAILPFKSEKEKSLRKKEFWAVKDISFTLRRGECIGLIGHNGAGKSTLLKMINGLINPDAGSIKLKGKIGALIELGAGFNPILTGRENIYNNAAVLGFSKKEIDAKMSAIIAFSEIEEFLDMPVQNYSSGMKVRLGFAIAAHLEPDVLIVDEVLAVGDLGFVLKCFKSIDELLPNTAMIFVSHSMPMVARICNQIILMKSGQSIYQGENVSAGIAKYYDMFESMDKEIVLESNKITNIEVVADEDCKWGGILNIKIKFKMMALDKIPSIYLIIKDKEQRGIAGIVFHEKIKVENKGQFVEVNALIPKVELSNGVYNIDLAIYESLFKGPLGRVSNVVSFSVYGGLQTWEAFHLESEWNFKLN